MDCKGCGKSIPGDSVFCPYCKKQARKVDSAISEKIKKKKGKAERGTDAPVDLEARKMKKRLILIGIPVLVVILAGVFWLVLRDTPQEDDISNHPFSDPLPADCPVETLNKWLPDTTFNSLIWGDYIVELPKYTQYADGASFENMDLSDFLLDTQMKLEEMFDDMVSVLPLQFEAGHENVNSKYITADVLDYSYILALEKLGYNFISYSYYSEGNNSIRTSILPYEINKNRILIYPGWGHVSLGGETTVGVSTDRIIEIEFYFEGCNLILQRNGVTVKMIPRRFVNEELNLVINHRLSEAPGNHAFAEIASIEHTATPLLADGTIRLSDGSFLSLNNEPDTSIAANIELYKNGIMRISKDESGENGLWVRYIWCDGDGLILIDKSGQHYLYQKPNREEPVYIVQRTEEENEIEETLMERLERALIEAGFKPIMDPRRGTVTADTSVLFGMGSHALSDEGKEYLGRYLEVIAEVVQSDEYVGSVASIIIEGHTCSWGTYEDNLRTSRNRANAVYNFALSVQPELAEIMETVGRAFEERIFDDDGKENVEASRRVVFLFEVRAPVA